MCDDLPDDEWLVIRHGGGTWAWNLGPADDEARYDLVARARVACGYPTGLDWFADPEQAQITVSPGEPHQTLLARATVGTLADLAAVDAGRLAELLEHLAAQDRQRQVDAALAVLGQLDPAALAAVLAHPDVQGGAA
ncbi:MAG: hypothetical protein V4515_12730 [Chloroflexota bacterium]